VYLERAGRAHRHRVAVRTLVGDRVAVEGLAADARVIGRGAAYVTDGAPVRIMDDEP